MFGVMGSSMSNRSAHEGLRLVGSRQGRHLCSQGMLNQGVLLFADRADAPVVFVVADFRGESIPPRARSHLAHFTCEMSNFAR